MNEIITKLNEIEEKAECILADAGARKDQMMREHEKEKRILDEKYERLQAEELKSFEEKLREEISGQVEAAHEDAQAKIEQLELMFAEKKESLAEDILGRIIQ